jgi:FlaA1/EpsC-like NDP-sugar epimerase
MPFGTFKTMNKWQKNIAFCLLDGAVTTTSLLAAVFFSEASVPFGLVLFIAVLGGVLSYVTRFSTVSTLKFEAGDRTRLIIFMLVMAGCLALLPLAYDDVYLLETGFLMICGGALAGSRLLPGYFLKRMNRIPTRPQRVLIYGAGQTGRYLASKLRLGDTFVPVAYIDDDMTLQNAVITGLDVHSRSDIPKLVRKKAFDHIILAMPAMSQAFRIQLLRELETLGCSIHGLPDLGVMDEHNLTSNIAPNNQFLNRSPLDPVLPMAVSGFRAQNILVTGAGGTIGLELCRQLLASSPDRLVLLDHSELALVEAYRMMTSLAPDLEIVQVLGTVCDGKAMSSLMSDYKINVVLHAAAYKHVSVVQQNLVSGVANNVLGTNTLAQAARAAGVAQFILISSDKAVRPTNAMGATKRLAELLVQALAARSGPTKFAIVRFGNVLGSSGSVLPLFTDQIARGGPVTVTHPDVKRYFMTVEEATGLVLLAAATSQGGEVFVLDMGEPMRIKTLAQKMIESAGLKVKDAQSPDGDIEIMITGLRPGEKLQEELCLTEGLMPTQHPKVFRTQEESLSELSAARVLSDLQAAVSTRNEAALLSVIERWVERPAEGLHVRVGE